MQPRQPRLNLKLPKVWMMSDERMGDAFLPALARLPKGSGVVFRHYALGNAERRALFAMARRIARARRIVLLLAGSERQARAWRADGTHGKPRHRSAGLHTAPVHNLRELIAAKQRGADLMFISPVFATRSHPDAPTIGHRGFASLTRRTAIPSIALGGMNAARARSLGLAYGWAGIDAWLPAAHN